jgi:hypothetical protein
VGFLVMVSNNKWNSIDEMANPPTTVISEYADGLIVFNIDLHQICYWNSAKKVCGGACIPGETLCNNNYRHNNFGSLDCSFISRSFSYFVKDERALSNKSQLGNGSHGSANGNGRNPMVNQNDSSNIASWQY